MPRTKKQSQGLRNGSKMRLIGMVADHGGEGCRDLDINAKLFAEKTFKFSAAALFFFFWKGVTVVDQVLVNCVG